MPYFLFFHRETGHVDASEYPKVDLAVFMLLLFINIKPSIYLNTLGKTHIYWNRNH